MILIIIHTDSDFSISYKGKNLRQHDEKIYLLYAKYDDFVDDEVKGLLTSSAPELFSTMVYGGEGEYGNYYLEEESYVPFIHNLGEANET